MNLQAVVERTVAALGYDPVDIEHGSRGLLRVYIDRLADRSYGPDGDSEYVTVEDCEKVTRQLQYVLEVEGVDYSRLEVSSPGLDRPLKRPADFARFVGCRVELTLRLPFQGRRKYIGELRAVGDTESGWRLVLDDDGVAAKPAGKVAAKAAAAKRQAKKAMAQDEVQGVALAAEVVPPQAVERALDFTLDEVREARLVPVVDFKGRREAPASLVPKSGPRAVASEARQDELDGGRKE